MNKIKILHTSDIHGAMFLTDYVNDVDHGFVKAAKYIREVKNNNGIYIDGGDLIQGSALSYYLTQIDSKSNPVIEAMNDLDADVLTFGNHEFNYGIEYLKKTVNSYKYNYNCANIKTDIFDIKPYKIIEKSGVKIAIISLVTSYIPNWEQKENIKGIKFLDVIKTYAKYEKELIEKSDFIIVNYHGGIEYDIDDFVSLTEKPIKENEAGMLVKTFDSIDVLFTGHQHREIATKINNTIIMQPLNQARLISEIEINLENKKITNFCLIDVANIIGDDANTKNILLKYHQKTNVFLDQKLAKLNQSCKIEDIFDARLNGHSAIKLLHQVQLYYSKADISEISLFDTAIGFEENITLRQVYANYPYPNTLKIVKVKKEILKQAIEKSYEYFVYNKKVEINKKYIVPKAQHYNFDMFYGENLFYRVDLKKEVGNRVTFTKEINDTVTIVMNNYRYSNIELFPMYKDIQLVSEIDTDMVSLLTKFFSENKNIKIDKILNMEIEY